MATTRRPIEALDYAKNFVKSMPVDRIAVSLLHSVHAELWTAGPWRWTLGNLANITLSGGSQDFTIASTPSDFLRLYKAYMTDGTKAVSFDIWPSIPPSSVTPGIAKNIAFVPGSPNILRLHPFPQSLPNANAWILVTWYKKIVPVLTPINVHTAGTLVMDDDWFWVYEYGVLTRAYIYSGDDKMALMTTGLYREGMKQMLASEPAIVLPTP